MYRLHRQRGLDGNDMEWRRGVSSIHNWCRIERVVVVVVLVLVLVEVGTASRIPSSSAHWVETAGLLTSSPKK